MAEFLTTARIASEVESIIQTAKERLVLASPCLQVSKSLLGPLRDAEAIGVETALVYGKVDLGPEEQAEAASLSNLALYLSEGLQATCYFNETRLVIASMNPCGFSERNSRAMGLLVTSGIDEEAYDGAVAEVEDIIRSARLQRPAEVPIRLRDGATHRVNGSDGVVASPSWGGNGEARPEREGACIRCAKSIPLNSYQPYCWDCYQAWLDYVNPHDAEKVCHGCGEAWETSRAKPLCSACSYSGSAPRRRVVGSHEHSPVC